MAKVLEISEGFKDDYNDLPAELQRKLEKQLRFLMENSAHPSLRVHKIKGTGGIIEAYIDKGYRFTFEDLGDRYYLRAAGTHKVIDIESRKRPAKK